MCLKQFPAPGPQWVFPEGLFATVTTQRTLFSPPTGAQGVVIAIHPFISPSIHRSSFHLPVCPCVDVSTRSNHPLSPFHPFTPTPLHPSSNILTLPPSIHHPSIHHPFIQYVHPSIHHPFIQYVHPSIHHPFIQYVHPYIIHSFSMFIHPYIIH